MGRGSSFRSGLVFSQRSGKHIEYEAAESRVRYQRLPNGKFSLALTDRSGGVELAITITDSGVSDRGP